MRLLIDTHILIWTSAQPGRLRAAMATALDKPDNDIYVSAASVWEISIKNALGRLAFPLELLDETLDNMQATALPVTISHAVAAGELPRHHNDPFDRMLVAQARSEGLVLVTEDMTMARYDVRIFGRR